jgi:dethiobiotin synthetase
LLNHQSIFITATNTDIGKTYTTLRLIDALSALGLNVGVFKPIETGVTDNPPDGTLLLHHAKAHNAFLSDITLNDVVPYQFALPAAPYVAKKGTPIDLAVIDKAYQKIAERSDIVLIEGAGGLMVPIEKDFFMIDLIQRFCCKILLVTGDYLGSINDTLLSIEALTNRELDFTWCINQRDNGFQTVTQPFYNDLYGEIATIQKDLDKIAKKLLG